MTMTTDVGEGAPDGLQQIRDGMIGGRKVGIGQTMGFAIVEADRGRVVVEGKPDRSVYNPLGTVHGGYAATLLDTACGICVHTTQGPGRGHTTLELKVSYLRALNENSGTVRAEGKVISVGNRVAFSEATLHDGEGRLCATATSTLLVFDVAPGGKGSFSAPPPAA